MVSHEAVPGGPSSSGGATGAKLKTYSVPGNSIAPHQSTNTISRGQFADSEEGKEQYNRARAEEKALHKQNLEEWIDKCNDYQTGTKLVRSDPDNQHALPLGMPKEIFPTAKYPKHGGPVDLALLVWKDDVELWGVAPIERLGSKHIAGVTAVFGFEAVDGTQGKEGTYYWLVGTSTAELHLLHGHDTKKGELVTIVTVSGVARQSNGATQPAITAISTLTKDKQDNAFAITKEQKGQILLFVGFADGSVRTFSLQELLDFKET